MSNPERRPKDDFDDFSLESLEGDAQPIQPTPVEKNEMSTFSREKQRQKPKTPLPPPEPSLAAPPPMRTRVLPTVEGFTVLGILGEGGMGTVFRARKNDSGREVALKLIGDKYINTALEPELRERFLRESKAAAKLRHPYIIQIYEIGESDHTPYFAMELCDAGSLEQYIRSRTLSFAESAKIVAQVAEAIQFAHENDIIHRDLKPANVLLCTQTDGSLRPKVADFGIAKFTDSDKSLTRTGKPLGTPYYMSPEQHRSGRSVTPAADVWSLGVILYEMICGAKPFEGNTYEVIAQVSTEQPAKPRQRVPEIPRQLEKICMKCLEKKPENRFTTAGELSEKLRAFVDSCREPEPKPRERSLPWLSMAIGLLLLSAGIWFFLQSQEAEKQRQIAETQYRELKKTLDAIPINPDDARKALKDSQEKLQKIEADLAASKLQEKTLSNQLSSTKSELETAQKKATDSLSQRDLAQKEVTRLTTDLEALKQQSVTIKGSTKEADAQIMALTRAKTKAEAEKQAADLKLSSANQEVTTLESKAKRFEAELKTARDDVTRFTNRVANLQADLEEKQTEITALRRDLREASFASSKTIRLADAFLDQGRFEDATALLLKVPPEERSIEWRLTFRNTRGSYGNLLGHEKSVWCVACSPDGSTIASASLDKKVKLWDARTGIEIMTLSDHEGQVFSVSFSPDGKRLISSSEDKTIKLWNVTTGDLIRSFTAHEGIVWSCRFNSDGSRFVSGAGDGKIMVWDPTKATPVKTFNSKHGDVSSVCFTPDGQYIVSGGYDAKIAIWSMNGKGEPWEINAHTRGVNCVDVSPDGKLIVSGSEDDRVKLWDFTTMVEKPIEIISHDDKVTGVAFSPDGTKFLSCSKDNALMVWDTKTGNPRARLRGHQRFVQSACFRGGGREIVSGGADSVVKIWDVNGLNCLVMRNHQDQVNSVSVSRDGVRIASASSDLSIRIWDGYSGNLRGILRGHTESVTSVSFADDGITLASGSGDNTVRLWNASTLTEIKRFTGHAKPIISVMLSPDGSRLISGDLDGVVKVWDTSSGDEVKSLTLEKDKQVWAVAISSDASQIAYGGTDRKVHVFDLTRNMKLNTFTEPMDRVNALAFSPSGSFLVAASSDQAVRIFDLIGGKEPKLLRGHRGIVRGVDVSRDGTRVFTCGDDKSMRIWDSRSGEELLWMMMGESRLMSISASGNGDRIVVGTNDKEVVVFDCRGPNASADGRDRLFRKQMSTFLPGWHKAQAASMTKINAFGEEQHKKWLNFKINDLSNYSEWDWLDLIRAYGEMNETELQRQAETEFTRRFGDATQRNALYRLSSAFCDPRYGVIIGPSIAANERKRFDALQKELRSIRDKK